MDSGIFAPETGKTIVYTCLSDTSGNKERIINESNTNVVKVNNPVKGSYKEPSSSIFW